MKTRRYVTFFSLLFLITLLIGLYFVPPVVSQKSGTERTTEYNSDGQLVSVERIHDNDLLVEKKEFDIKTGKLRRRITYKYLKGFKQADTSTTTYQADGKTQQSTTNVDHDKDGNTTSATTTNYDETGKETGGSKRETDPKTGKARCYNWIPSKQVYEEVECPKKPWVSSVGDNAKVETGGGLIKVNFNVEGGRIIVNLPDDLMAGDTISGTVLEEPNHKSPIDNDAFFVRQVYLDLLGRQSGPSDTQHWISILGEKGSAPPPVKFTVDIPENQPIPIILRDKDGNPIGSITLPQIFVLPPSTGSTVPSSFQIPTLGQAGRPIEIIGPFDGNSDDTHVRWCINLQVTDCAQNPSTGGTLKPVAESPRKLIVDTPINVLGPIQIEVADGSTRSANPFRNVGVRLSAPKTSLVKGERTQLTITVEGLQGLTTRVPLTLTSNGVVNMQDGPFQQFMIEPKQVDSSGRFTVNRNVTGLQAGAWGATATVVTSKFDVCLQDDNSPVNVVLFNSFTGDYMFKCPGCDGGVNAKAFEIKDFSFGVENPTTLGPAIRGAGQANIKDCQINVQGANKDRKVLIQFNACTNSGNASIDQPRPRIKFTITDRNTRDNTCTAR